MGKASLFGHVRGLRGWGSRAHLLSTVHSPRPGHVGHHGPPCNAFQTTPPTQSILFVLYFSSFRVGFQVLIPTKHLPPTLPHILCETSVILRELRFLKAGHFDQHEQGGARSLAHKAGTFRGGCPSTHSETSLNTPHLEGYYPRGFG